MSHSVLSRCPVLLALTLAAALTPPRPAAVWAESPANTAIVPVAKLENDSYDWYARHEAVLKIKDRFLDLGQQFLLPNGELPRQLMSDFCHPTEEGYAIWASALKPLLQDAEPSPGVGAAVAEPERLSLWSGRAPVGDDQFEAGDAFITAHRPAPDGANGAALVICPGGGYGGLVTGAEGHGIAKWLNAHGIAGVVLEYRLPKGRSFRRSRAERLPGPNVGRLAGQVTRVACRAEDDSFNGRDNAG